MEENWYLDKLDISAPLRSTIFEEAREVAARDARQDGARVGGLVVVLVGCLVVVRLPLGPHPRRVALRGVLCAKPDIKLVEQNPA